jgi:hypothetical protein
MLERGLRALAIPIREKPVSRKRSAVVSRAEELAHEVLRRQLTETGYVENSALLFFGDDGAEEHRADPDEDWESFSAYVEEAVEEHDPAAVLLIHRPTRPDTVSALYLDRRTSRTEELQLEHPELD